MQKSLNELTDKEFEEIRKLSALFFTPAEIAEMLELDINLFAKECETPGTKCHASFRGGWFDGEIDVRTGIMKMAKAGSTPAQTAALEILKKSVFKMTN